MIFFTIEIPYSKLFRGRTFLIVNRFSKFLQRFLGQTKRIKDILEKLLSESRNYTLILFVKWHFQKFSSMFSKGRYFKRGDDSKKKYVSAIFHEESANEVSRRYLIPEYHSCEISGSEI